LVDLLLRFWSFALFDFHLAGWLMLFAVEIDWFEPDSMMMADWRSWKPVEGIAVD